MLEGLNHTDKNFTTLTYSDEEVPTDGSLNPRHTQLFLKRLRKRYAPAKIRYFLVGEYGDETQRPHYHAALFGVPQCRYGRSRYSRSRDRCCAVCDSVRDAWGFGHVFLGDLSKESAQYIAGYVTKKMTAKDDERLQGRHPEYARMSLRPGIGQHAMHDLADVLLRYGVGTDVPNALRHGPAQLPLGRYLQQQLRKMVGRDAKAPEEVIQALKAQLLPLQAAARSVTPQGVSYEFMFKEFILQATDDQYKRQLYKTRFFSKKRQL